MILVFREFDYDNKPVVDIVNEMIIDAVKHGASDIHFDPTENEVIVRIRIDGSLLEYAKVPVTVKKNLITRIKIISGMNITESRLPQDGAIKRLDDGVKMDLRVSSLPTIHGEKIVIRILNYSLSLAGLETLGLAPDNLTKIKKAIAAPNGIILLAGATGSGKSTTVYAMLQVLNTPERNIITVEDPVEMKMQGLNQVQVMSEIGLDFNTTLRSILRQDPDIIMIGEIRDDETARIAVRASITGHLVLSTIHTNNSLNTIERLLDMEVERYLLGTSLDCIVSQRLVKKLCPKCRKSRPTTAYEKNLFKAVSGKDIESIYEPVGCDNCIGGYKGRTGVHEVLLLNQEIRDAITNNLRKEELRKLVYNKKNTCTLLEDGIDKVIAGTTSLDEVLRVISVEDDFGKDDDDVKQAFIGKTVENNMQKKNDTEEKEVVVETPTQVETATSIPEQVETPATPVIPVVEQPVQPTPEAPVQAPQPVIEQPVVAPVVEQPVVTPPLPSSDEAEMELPKQVESIDAL